MYNKRTLLTLSFLAIHFYIKSHACEKYRFVKEDDVELQDHVITTMTTPYVELCWDKCVWIMDCFSINVRNTNFGTVECDLNNSSKKASPGSLVPIQGSQYHQFGEVRDCLTIDCRRKEGILSIIGKVKCTTDVFMLHEKLNSLIFARSVQMWCINMKNTYSKPALAGWYRLGNSALKIFLENKNWTDARAHCQSLGGDLVSITSDYGNRFTHNVLAKTSTFKKRDWYLEGNLTENLVNIWLLNGTDSNVTLLGNPGAARYETTDGERTLYLSGYNGYARLPAVAFNPAGFTFMIWVKPGNQSGINNVIYGDWIPIRTFLLEIRTNPNYLLYRMKNSESVAQALRTDSSSIQLNEWIHVAITLNMSQRSQRLFVNGIAMDEDVLDEHVTIRIASNEYFLLGLENDQVQNINRSFHGHLKHLMIFNRSLSVEEIQTAMYWSEEGPWIGLHAQENANAFNWSGGKEVMFRALPSYHPQPLHSARKCVAIGNKGYWFDKHCHEKKAYICEKIIV